MRRMKKEGQEGGEEEEEGKNSQIKKTVERDYFITVILKGCKKRLGPGQQNKMW